MDIKSWLIDWFATHADVDREEIVGKTGKNYFECAWIDSLKFVFFINDIEAHFDVHFSNSEFQNRGFATIDGLAIIIEGKLNEK